MQHDGALAAGAGTAGAVGGTGQAKVPAFLNKLFRCVIVWPFFAIGCVGFRG